MRIVIDLHADATVGSPCACNNGVRTTQCHNCIQYETSCNDCFVKAHRNLPFHWAQVWERDRGYFTRCDLSVLGGAVHLGHNGERCPNSSTEYLFTIVDSNGVHLTKLSFCGCVGSEERLKQLTRAQLFPTMTKDPRTAFTFSILKQFHLHTLESKKAAYDYLGALRRLSDNSFTADVPVSIPCIIITIFW